MSAVSRISYIPPLWTGIKQLSDALRVKQFIIYLTFSPLFQFFLELPIFSPLVAIAKIFCGGKVFLSKSLH